MAEIVMVRLVEDAGLAHRVAVDSAGTGDWHIGERADRRAVAALAARGYDGGAHRAKQFDPLWFRDRDLVVGLARGHARTLRSWADDGTRSRVHLLRSFDPAVGPDAGHLLDVADPYYDGPAAFDQVLDQIETACRGLLEHVRRGSTSGDRSVPTAAAGPVALPVGRSRRLDLTARPARATAGPSTEQQD
jgi:protein-tyrosine phosphatase